MKRKVLFIPIEEIKKHFAKNSRQDVKVIAPDILTDELFNILKAKGKDVKPEQYLEGDIWKHSEANEPNNLCESGEFIDSCLPQYVQGPFAVSFANEKAQQDVHYHRKHLEIYFSEHAIGAEFRCIGDVQPQSINLESGGAIIFGPGVIHKMQLGGLTIVIEIPAVTGDKVSDKL